MDKLISIKEARIKKGLSINDLSKALKLDLEIIRLLDDNLKLPKKYRAYQSTYKKSIYRYLGYEIKYKNSISDIPIDYTKTSIVFSYKGVKIDDEKIIDIFKKYNSFYAFTKINKIENFTLSFEMLRNYTYNNILAFGDLIHRIHPLAGQGFNMTIRDIKIMSKIVNHRISLGLPIDISVAEEFQNSTKHLNYLYGKAIDGIYEFFRLDSNINNSISKPVFSILNKNSIFKKYSNILSDKGFNL